MKRQKRLTKKERKDARGARGGASPGSGGHAHHHHGHIHCIACGKHLDPDIFGEPEGADFLRCDHGHDFPHCVGCRDRAQALVDEHERTGEPVNITAAWH